MIVVRGYGDFPPDSDPEYKHFRHWIEEDHVGGFIVAGRIRHGNVIPAQPFEMAAFINKTQHDSKLPLWWHPILNAAHPCASSVRRHFPT